MRKVVGLGRRAVTGWIAASTLGVPLSTARAEISEVRIAQQFGLTFLPLIVARNRQLIEAHARAAGLDNLKVNWVRLGGGAAVNDALISGSIEFATAGLGPLLTLWDKTRANLDVRGVLSLDASAVLLNVNRPDLKTLFDLKDSDRIALPAVKVSHQAILLQMAAAKAFGADQYTRLDKLTVTLPHPEAYVALLSGKSEITGHFGNSPFVYQELDNPKIHRLLSSEEILGGLGTVTSVFTTAKVRDANPKVYKAVLDGLREAIDIINRDKLLAARIFVEEEKSTLTAEYVQKLLEAPSALYSAAPVNSFQFVEFMSRTGALKNKPASWRDYFFPDIHALSGG
jgi:NitT/TauT family transport system substrate-binding protein